MPSSRRSFVSAAPLRRPAGPRCRGGGSSLFRPRFGVAAPRAATCPSGWRDRAEASDAAAVEHVVGWPGRADRGAGLAC
jgi:hypothetical protein